MALSKEIYGAVGTPRIYIDYVQYAKAIGMVKFYYGRDFYNVNGTYADAWDFNPTKTSTYQVRDSNGYPRLGVVFKNSDAEIPVDGDDGEGIPPTDSVRNMQFRLLLDTINYYGLLNHNLGTFYTSNATQRQCSLGTTTRHNSRSEIVGHLDTSDINDVGYSLAKHNYFKGGGVDYDAINYPEYYEGLYIQVKNCINDSDAYGNVEPLLNLGTITAGRYFDLPHNADVDVSLGFDFSGITRNKTVSGDTLTQINYKRPKWGDLRAWTNIDLTPYQEQGIDPKQALLDQDYSTTGLQGRRSWDLSFSYISKDDMFPKNFDGNMSGDYEATTSNFTWDEDSSIVSSWANATLGFTLPFILQVDRNKQDFAIVKAKANSIKVSQQAPMLYKFSITLIEQY